MGCKAVYPRYVWFKHAIRKQHSADGSVFGALHKKAVTNLHHFTDGAAPRSRPSNQLGSGAQCAKSLRDSRVLFGHEFATTDVGLAIRLDAFDESKHEWMVRQLTKVFNPNRPVAGSTP